MRQGLPKGLWPLRRYGLPPPGAVAMSPDRAKGQARKPSRDTWSFSLGAGAAVLSKSGIVGTLATALVSFSSCEKKNGRFPPNKVVNGRSSFKYK